MRTAFVGRQRELELLGDCLTSARAGHPRVVLCRGEPGIGKTRLAEEFSAAAEAYGVLAVWGAAAGSAGAPPYWPWRQVLRALSEDVDLGAVAREHRLTADLTRLAPDLFACSECSGHGSGSSEDRFRLFDAVARLLREVTRDRCVVIVFDDAHWCDTSSLLLLQHIAHSMTTQQLLILVNHRDTEPLSGVLVTELAREPVTRELGVSGLDRPAVGEHLAAVLGSDPTDAQVTSIHARTGGNPFYVSEVGGALAERNGGRSTPPVPTNVRTAIGSRLERLSPPSIQLLQTASVVGREFPIGVVAAMVDRPVTSCLTGLDEATAAGLVEETGTPGEHRFAHDLVRDAVEAGLGAPERVRLHRRAAEVLEELFAGRLEPHLSDLARHWAVAAMGGERARAVVCIRRAADEAMHRLAYEEGARLYRLALAAGADEVDDVARCRLLLDAAGALKHAGELTDRLAACREAAALARRLARPDLLAEAAMALEGGEADLESESTLRRLCEEALAALGPQPTGVRARVSANLSDACMYLGDVDAAARASEHALDEANRSGDLGAVAAALRARQLVATGPDGMDERARLADRMDAVSRGSGDPVPRMWAHLWRIDVAFERGDLAAVMQELDPLGRCTEEVGGPVARWHLLQARAVLAQAQARFADARGLAEQAFAALPPSATGYGSSIIQRTAVLSAIGLHTGQAPELSGLLGDGGPGDAVGTELDFPTEGVIFAIGAAFFLAYGGRLPDAATVYRRLGPPAGWRPIPHATTSSFALGIGTAIALDASEDVAALRGRLDGYRGRHVADGSGAVAYNGPVELYLGMAAGHLELLDDAVAELETAAQACTANGAAGFEVQAQYELAAVLTRRARPGDLPRARALAGDVGARAAALGMPPWADRARRLVERLDDDRGDPLTPRENEVAVLVGKGLTNRQIASRLYLSERTAQNHVQHILTKLGLPNRSQIAVWVSTRNE